ncbi:MAG TPA: HAD-IA family hydrolase [Candidatus Acidoferrales bacterium]|nr:HAD-IA family hydrolase [Candidatus Acidoferrales bacterium]
MNARKIARAATAPWEVIIFDVDGVLVDVRESYQRTVLETVRHFTGKRVGRRELHEWKNRSGFNDDWTLTHAWVNKLGARFSYDDVKKQFENLYWADGKHGNVAGERWLLPEKQLAKLSRRARLAIFTGRTRSELSHTLERFDVRRYFSSIVTVESISKPKPDPEGLLQILNGLPASKAIYLGDNVDDAFAAKAAGMAFVGVLPRGSVERRVRAGRLRALGAQTILGDVTEIEKWLARRRPVAQNEKKRRQK